MEKAIVFGGMALVTYLTRFTMIAVLGRELPPIVRRWLGYVPAAVLAALVAPAALLPQGELVLGPRAWAALIGAAVAWRTRNILLTIGLGMGAFWLLKALGI